MKTETPATGILTHGSYGDLIIYHIECECSNPDCAHSLCIEACGNDITVELSTVQKTDFWSKNVETRYDIDNTVLQEWHWIWTNFWNGLFTRLRITKDVWINGHARYEGHLIMSKQTALNYSAALKNAIKDVEKFASTKVPKL